MSAITQRDRHLLTLILTPSLSLTDLLEAGGLAIDQLLDWADSPPIRRTLERLQRLADLRTTLTASLVGPTATSSLAALLDTADNPAERRRLATTLIRTGRPPRQPRPRASSGTGSVSDRASSPREDPSPPSTYDQIHTARLGTRHTAPESPPAPPPPATHPTLTPSSPGPALRSRNSRAASLMHRAGAAELPRAG